jgi:hypothetical protein
LRSRRRRAESGLSSDRKSRLPVAHIGSGGIEGGSPIGFCPGEGSGWGGNGVCGGAGFGISGKSGGGGDPGFGSSGVGIESGTGSSVDMAMISP